MPGNYKMKFFAVRFSANTMELYQQCSPDGYLLCAGSYLHK